MALSQRSASKSIVNCIEFEVIADVDAKVGVDLEMDFRDDGTSEYKQHIPESHWAKLRFLVRAPTWYDGVRFILRKTGKGRAVLAQIQASSGSGCAGEPLTLADRPLGAACEVPEQCATGVCGEASVDPDGGWGKLKCGECTNDDPCSDGAVCGFGLSEVGTYARCTPTGSSPSGTSCVTDAECASGLCEPPKDEPCTPCEGNDCSDDAASQCDARSFAGTCR
jgi:hypothetical protein